MIEIDKSAELELKPEHVWEQFARQALSAADESKGTAPPFIVRSVSGSGLGCRFEAGNPNRKLMAWEITEWSPPRRFACKSERPGRFGGYCLFLSAQIDSAGEERSRLRMRFSLVYNNPFVALLAKVFAPKLSALEDAEGLVGSLGKPHKS